MKFHFSSKIKWASVRHFFSTQSKVSLLIKRPLAMASLYGVLFFLPFLPVLMGRAKQDHLEQMEKEIDQVKGRILHFLKYQKEKTGFFQHYQNTDPAYLEHTLDTVRYLNPEVSALKHMQNHPAFQHCHFVKNRLHYLTQGENKLLFSKEKEQVTKQVEEQAFKQLHPIEINREDLKHLLTLIENVEIKPYPLPANRPQLTIKSLHLQKKEHTSQGTYLLGMDLIQRKPLRNQGET